MLTVFGQMVPVPVFIPDPPQNEEQATAQVIGYLIGSGFAALVFLVILVWLYVKRDSEGRDIIWVAFICHFALFLFMLLALRT